MSREELLRALRGLTVETGSLACLGCGYEHGCSTHGCAVLRAAVERLTELTAQPPNPPLTHDSATASSRGRAELDSAQALDAPAALSLEELREMDGEPVWVVHPENLFEPCWMLVMVRHDFVMANWQVCDFNTYGKTWLAYRRKPEEEAMR